MHENHVNEKSRKVQDSKEGTISKKGERHVSVKNRNNEGIVSKGRKACQLERQESKVEKASKFLFSSMKAHWLRKVGHTKRKFNHEVKFVYKRMIAHPPHIFWHFFWE